MITNFTFLDLIIVNGSELESKVTKVLISYIHSQSELIFKYRKPIHLRIFFFPDPQSCQALQLAKNNTNKDFINKQENQFILHLLQEFYILVENMYSKNNFSEYFVLMEEHITFLLFYKIKSKEIIDELISPIYINCDKNSLISCIYESLLMEKGSVNKFNKKYKRSIRKNIQSRKLHKHIKIDKTDYFKSIIPLTYFCDNIIEEVKICNYSNPIVYTEFDEYLKLPWLSESEFGSNINPKLNSKLMISILYYIFNYCITDTERLKYNMNTPNQNVIKYFSQNNKIFDIISDKYIKTIFKINNLAQIYFNIFKLMKFKQTYTGTDILINYNIEWVNLREPQEFTKFLSRTFKYFVKNFISSHNKIIWEHMEAEFKIKNLSSDSIFNILMKHISNNYYMLDDSNLIKQREKRVQELEKINFFELLYSFSVQRDIKSVINDLFGSLDNYINEKQKNKKSKLREQAIDYIIRIKGYITTIMFYGMLSKEKEKFVFNLLTQKQEYCVFYEYHIAQEKEENNSSINRNKPINLKISQKKIPFNDYIADLIHINFAYDFKNFNDKMAKSQTNHVISMLNEMEDYFFNLCLYCHEEIYYLDNFKKPHPIQI